MGVFKIPDIPRYGIVLEEDLKNSIFQGVYVGAARSVAEIIKHNQEEKTGELFLNSSVVFTGERGSGKSSAMNTFSKFLGDPVGEHTWLDKENRRIIAENKFYVLQPIDATQMGLKETLLGSISAKMFNAFQEKQKNVLQLNSKVTLEQQREFVRKAQHVNRVAYMYQTGDWYENNDELLQNTTSIEGLKDEFHKLVECFLGLMVNAYDKKNTYLVVVVDDIDMSMENSFSIVDEIRKFLTEKNIIVLTSVHMEQLKKVLTEHFCQSLTSRGKIDGKPSLYHTASSLAEKYIEKIFPIARQHRMPRLTFDQLSSYTIENLIENTDDEKEYWSALNIQLPENASNPTIMHGVLHLIYKKTLLLLLPNEYNRHWFIPQNIRSLVNLVMFLKDMEDVAYIKDESGRFHVATNDELKRKSDIIEKNLDALMRYVVDDMSSFVASDVNEEDDTLAAVLKQLIQDLPDWSLDTINAKIVRDILHHVEGVSLKSNNKKFYSELFSRSFEVLWDASKHSKLVSMGDVLYILGKIDSKTNSWEIKRLIEIVRVVWSIRATKEFFVNGIGQEKLDESDCGKYITHPFRYMVGGFMVNPDCSKFLPYNYGKIQNEITTDWIFCTFDPKKYSDIYTEEEKSSILEALNFIYVFQPPVDCIRGLKATEKILPLTDWRIHDNHEEAYFERVIQTSSNSPVHLALNYMSLFTNMLSANILGNRIASRTIQGADADNDHPLITLANEWQKKYIMFFPFYSMDYMYCLYNRAHRDSLKRTRQYSDLKSGLEGFLEVFCAQTHNIENDIMKSYLNIDFCKESEKSLAVCCYSNRMDSFKKQVTQGTENTLTDKLSKLLDDINGDIERLTKVIDDFVAKVSNEDQNDLLVTFSNYVTNLYTGIDEYSPNIIKKELLDTKNYIYPENHEKIIEEIRYIIDDYVEDKTLEAYVY